MYDSLCSNSISKMSDVFNRSESPAILEREKTSDPWKTRGETFSENSAIKEYPTLTKEIIHQALADGKLEGRHGTWYGNSYLKLIRSEVEALVKEKFGDGCMQIEAKKARLKGIRSQLRGIPKELENARRELERLEEKQQRLITQEQELMEELSEHAPSRRGKGRVTKDDACGGAGAGAKRPIAVKRKIVGDKENEEDL